MNDFIGISGWSHLLDDVSGWIYFHEKAFCDKVCDDTFRKLKKLESLSESLFMLCYKGCR